MKVKALFIPPSSHFLKSLVNHLTKILPFESPEISKHFIIFPTQRACYFFKYYLTEKLGKRDFFFPKVLSWKEFLQFLYLELTSKPALILPDSAKILFFLRSLEFENLEDDPFKLFFWSSKFLEVFEEFEKEGKIPPNLLYPPEELPESAKRIFENLSKTYNSFKDLLTEKGVLFSSFLLKEVRDLLLSQRNKLGQLFKGLYFCGFAALRNTEREIWEFLKELQISSNQPFAVFFEDFIPPHPIIRETIHNLNLEISEFPKEDLEITEDEKEIYLYSFPEIESEVEKALTLIYPSSKPDELALVLPQSLTLLPLLHRLEDKDLEVNITLPFPSSLLPLNQFVLHLLKAQHERREDRYPREHFFKIIDHPFLKARFRETPLFFNLLKKFKTHFESKKYLEISKRELEEVLSPLEKEFFEKLYQILFGNWENLKSREESKKAIEDLLEFLKPLLNSHAKEDHFYAFLLRAYFSFLEKEILPLFEYPLFWEDFLFKENENFYLLFLEYLLNSSELSLLGEPLTGIQILGFLETRLLFFENLIVFDVNEGSLPPSPPFNPLLTEEIKRYLGLPIYRNELWDYYFERLLSASKKIHLFYLKSSKGKGDLVREPSRFIQKLKWRSEKEKRPLKESKFSQTFITPKRLEFLEKTKEDSDYLLSYFEKGFLSRSFLETYLSCPVKFYFQYLLGLKGEEDPFSQDKLVGNFLHQFFESLFLKYLNKSLTFTELAQNSFWISLFKDLWKKFEFEKIFDPLSVFLSEKLALASIKNYFEYISALEKSGNLKESFILGVENELFWKIPFNSFELTLWGRIDFIIKRKEGVIRYYLFDFKSNWKKAPAPKSVFKLLKFNSPETYDQESLKALRDCFGSELTNFQLLFYLYLFLKNKSQFIKENHLSRIEINTGYLTPSNLEKPEKCLLNLKPKDYTHFIQFMERKFENIIIFILNHMLHSQVFYFAEDELTCRFCNYRLPCQNLQSQSLKI